MRDLWIHDDDLIVATHGRGFWILDDIAPLREASADASQIPRICSRLRRHTASSATRTPTLRFRPTNRWPPILRMARSSTTICPQPRAQSRSRFSMRKMQLVRSFSNTDKPEITEEELAEAIDPAVLGSRAAASLDRSRACIAGSGICIILRPLSMRHEYPIAAVPHDTPRGPLGPTVLPGTYRVRLTVDGKPCTAPLTVKMDPRVKNTACRFAEESIRPKRVWLRS